METTLKTINIILVDELGKEKLNRYNVGQFCQRANISRATFYRTFNGMDGLFQFYCATKTQIKLGIISDRTAKNQFATLIQEIYDHRLVYSNIYRQTGPLFFNHVLNPIFVKFLKHYYQDQQVSDFAFEMLAQCLSQALVEWIDADCEQPPAQIEKIIANHFITAEKIAHLN